MPEFEGDRKDFVRDYYINMTKIGNLRSNKALSALKNGDTIALPLQNGKAYNEQISYDTKVAATFRYDGNGSQVICLYTTAGAESAEEKIENEKEKKAKAENKEYIKKEMNQPVNGSKIMVRPTVTLDKIILNDTSNWKTGIKGGLQVGVKFKKYGDSSDTYVVCLENGQYVLREENGNPIKISPKDKNTAILFKYDENALRPVPAHFILTQK